MPKNPVKAEVNSFIGGLVTEASALNFPPNASPDIVNFEHNRDGTIRRRLGMNYEPSSVLFDPPAAANNIEPPNPVVFKWTNVAGISDLTILAIQFDNSLMFFDMDSSKLSSEGLLGQVTLTDFPKDVRYGLSSVDGRLVVVAGVELVAVVTYSSGLFSVTYDRLRTRDLWGIAGTDTEGIKYENDPLYRGSVASPAHLYNLQNQSWGSLRSRESDGASADPITLYRNALGVYPSNSEQVWSGLQYKPDAGGNPSERYYPAMSRDLFGTALRAAKGFFVIDVIERGTSRLEAVAANNARNGGSALAYTVPSLPDYTEGGATVITEFAGRVFFGGFSGETIGGDARSPNLSSYIFFSQLVKSTADIYRCYQQGDPTARDDSDLLETDGGFVRIAGADRVLGMVPIGASLVVVCSNGVWAITGGSDYGFSATNYRVDKISSFGCVAQSSIVEERGRVFFWGEEGVFAVARNQLGDLAADNISKGRIDKFYKAISIASRITVVGTHDSFSGKVRWMYEGNAGETYELILDTELSAFYPFKIQYPNAELRLVGLFTTSPFSRTSTTDEVFSATDAVLSVTDPVIVDSTVFDSSLSSVKYLVKVGSKYTFSYYRDENFRDWASYNGLGVDAKALCTTGAMVVSDSSVRKQIQFLTVHFKRTAYFDEFSGEIVNDTSCFSNVKWDWSGTIESLKWSSLRQLYRNPKPSEVINFDVVTTRNMVRGQGRAFAVYFETAPYKDCHLIGWSLAADGNTRT